ncbi:MAG TPA: hypothetical protein VNM24_17135 [Burkholderiales bacterium]|jgi:hypothetical protein|nr:hypothetical protein [Burkholderiales bacterium]
MRAAYFLLLACALPLLVHAEEPVPIEQEPRHRLRFENPHVRFFDVDLPPGYEGRYHWHTNDGVFVNILPAETIAQDLGKEPEKRGWRAIGETYFIGYRDKPKAHRVSNSDTQNYRVTDTEIVRGCGATQPLVEAAGQTLIVDNARVFVTRIILHPGESTELHGPCGMLVSVSEGSLQIAAGGLEQAIGLGRAGFHWRQSVEPHKLTNVGRNVFHAVDIRLK